MKSNIFNLIFAAMSFTLIMGSSFICVDELGDINFSFMHDVHSDECNSTNACDEQHSSCGDCDLPDVCYGNHSSCGDLVVDLSAIITAGITQPKLLDRMFQNPEFTLSPQIGDTYLTTIIVSIFPPQIINQLSTVVVRT